MDLICILIFIDYQCILNLHQIGSPADDEQLYFNMCEFVYFYDQVGFEMD